MGSVVLSLLVAAAPGARATPAEESTAVVTTVQHFFDAMAACDVQALRGLVEPEGRLFHVRPGSDGAPAVGVSTFTEFLGHLQPPCKERLLERMWEPQVRVHGPIATLWAPYDFWRGVTFSHCGVDAFDLVKTTTGWKITGVLYTVEPRDCAPSPLGPPVAPAASAPGPPSGSRSSSRSGPAT
jgi:hypothetical protein